MSHGCVSVVFVTTLRWSPPESLTNCPSVMAYASLHYDGSYVVVVGHCLVQRFQDYASYSLASGIS